MRGAKLQSAGQVRNSFPYVARKLIKVSVQWLSAAPIVLPYSISDVVDTDLLPFDTGVDKSGRVYPVIIGYNILIDNDTPAGPTGIVNGEVNYIDNANNRYNLGVFADNFTTRARAYHFPNIIVPYTPLFAANVARIGRIEWVNLNSTLGNFLNTAFITVYLNVGYFGDYAEPDYDEMLEALKSIGSALHPMRNIREYEDTNV